MSDKSLIFCYVFWLLVCLSLAITFFSLMKTTEVFTVPGKLTKIDSCFENCYTNGADAGCFNQSVVSFEYLFQNKTFYASQFHCGIDTCLDCCYRFLNHTIQVEINENDPSTPIRFWNENEKPYSMAFSILGVIFGIVTFVMLGTGCVFVYSYLRNFQYQQLN